MRKANYPSGYHDFPTWLQRQVRRLHTDGINISSVTVLDHPAQIWMARAIDDVYYTPDFGGSPPQPFTLYVNDSDRTIIPDGLGPQVIAYLEGVVSTDQRPVEVRLQEAQERLVLYMQQRIEALAKTPVEKWDKVELVYGWPIKTLTEEISRLQHGNSQGSKQQDAAAGEHAVEISESLRGHPENTG